MSEALAYAAGIVDGEGTVALPARVAVKMTDREPLAFLERELGGILYEWKTLASGRRVYEWRVNGLGPVLEIGNLLRPYLTVKRRQFDVLDSYQRYHESYPDQDISFPARYQLSALKSPDRENYAVFDLETTGLDGTVDSLLSYSFWTPRDGTLSDWVVPLDDTDELVAYACRQALEMAPFTVGWNTSGFDIRFLNQRLGQYGHRPIFLGSHDDAKYMYGNGRASLERAANELAVTDEKVHKTPIDWVIWGAAKGGDQEAMKYIVDHCEKDVKLTSRVYAAIVNGYGG